MGRFVDSELNTRVPGRRSQPLHGNCTRVVMRILVSHRTRSLVPTVAHLLEALQQRFGMHAVKVDTPQTSTMKVRRKEKGRRRDKRGRRGRTGLASAPAAPRAWLGDAQALVVVIDPHWTQALALKRDRVRGLLEAAFEKEAAPRKIIRCDHVMH